MTDFSIVVKLDTQQAQQGSTDLEAKLEQVAEVAARIGTEAGIEIGRGMERARAESTKALNNIKAQLDTVGKSIRNAFAFAGIGLGIRELARMADAVTQTRNQIRGLVEDEKTLNSVVDELFKVSERSRASFEQVGELYDRLAKSTRAYGISQRDALRITETLAKTFVEEGKSIGEVEGVVRQLSVAFSTGSLSSRQFRGILAQFPEVLDLLANHFGKTREELFRMAEAGELTGKALIDAFLASSQAVDQSFAKVVPTISSAITAIQSAFQRVISEADQGTGALRLFAEGLLFLARNMETVVIGIGVFVTALIGLKIIGTVSAAISGLATAVTLLSRAMLFLARNPMVLVATAAAAIILSTDQAQAAISEFFESVQNVPGAPDGLIKDIGDHLRNAGIAGATAGQRIEDGMADAAAAVDSTTSATSSLTSANSGLRSSLSGVAAGYDDVAASAKRAADAAAAMYQQQQYYQSRYGAPTPIDYSNDYFPTIGNSGDSVIYRASGGPVGRGQMAMVGELGPELIMAAKDSLVLPNDITEQLLARGVPGFARGGVVGRGNRGYVDYAGGGRGRPLPGGSSSSTMPIIAGERGRELIIDPNALTIGLDNSYESFQDVYRDAARIVQFDFSKLMEDDTTKAVRAVTGGDLRRGGGRGSGRGGRGGGAYGGGTIAQGEGGKLEAFMDKHPGEFVVHILSGYGGINSIGPLTFDNQLLRLVATGLTQEDIKDPTIIASKYRGNGLFNAGYAADQVAVGKYTIKDRRLYVWDQWLSERFRNELKEIPVGARIDSSAVGTIGTGGWASNSPGIRGTHFHHPALGSRGFNEFTPDRSHFPDLESLNPIIAPNGELSYLKAAEDAEWRLTGYDRSGAPQYEWSGGYISVDAYNALEPRLIRNRYGTGGSFTVGGTGGVDSQLVSFLASPGETVDVKPPGAARSGGGGAGMSITINVNGVTDAESFRRSETQIVAELRAKLRAIEGRTG